MVEDAANTLMDAICDRVRTIRMELGLSQEDFAEKLGVSRGYISNIENKKAEPSISILHKVELVSQGRISLYTLLFGEGTFRGEANAGAVNRAATADRFARTAAIRVSDALERQEGQPWPPHLKALFQIDLERRYVEVYQGEKLAGASPADARRAADAAVEAVGFGQGGK